MAENETITNQPTLTTADTLPESVSRQWLYNPIAAAQMGGDFTLIQQRVFGGILEQLQDRILYSIQEKKQNERFPSLFTDEEMSSNLELFIDPATLGIPPGHYDLLADALRELVKMTVYYPKEEKGVKSLVCAPLFARLEMPYFGGRRTGKIRVVMLKENLQDFYSMDKGYTYMIARITRISKKKRTPRIYNFLTTFRKVDDTEHIRVRYDYFLRFLGIDEDTARADLMARLDQQVKEWDEDTLAGVEPDRRRGIPKKERNERLEAWDNPFRKFSKVKSLVLDPSKQELDEFCRDRQVDFSFDYEPLYEGGRVRGNPSHLQFRIINGPLADEREQEMATSRQIQTFLNSMCNWCIDLRRFELQELLLTVRKQHPDWLGDLIDFGYHDVRTLFERRQPDNGRAYVMTLLGNWVRDRERTETAQGVKTCNLFDSPGIGETNVRWRRAWQKCQQQMCSGVSADVAEVYSRLSMEAYDQATHTLSLHLPDQESFRTIEERLYGCFARCVREWFGQQVVVKYRIG